MEYRQRRGTFSFWDPFGYRHLDTPTEEPKEPEGDLKEVTCRYVNCEHKESIEHRRAYYDLFPYCLCTRKRASGPIFPKHFLHVKCLRIMVGECVKKNICPSFGSRLRIRRFGPYTSVMHSILCYLDEDGLWWTLLDIFRQIGFLWVQWHIFEPEVLHNMDLSSFSGVWTLAMRTVGLLMPIAGWAYKVYYYFNFRRKCLQVALSRVDQVERVVNPFRRDPIEIGFE